MERCAQEVLRRCHDQLALTRQRLDHLALRLDILNPERVLLRGYAWVTDGKGAAVTAVNQVQSGDVVTVKLSDGDLSVVVRPLGPEYLSTM